MLNTFDTAIYKLV